MPRRAYLREAARQGRVELVHDPLEVEVCPTMSGIDDPARDPTLQALKRMASRGGDRGPLFDQGILATVSQIEREGYFTRGGTASLLSRMHIQQQSAARMLTDEEVAGGQRFLAQRGWTIEQGSQYAHGALFAEGILFYFGREREQ